MTFLRNHKDGIAAMDFFVVPTIGFRLLYVWFVIDHGRRRMRFDNAQAEKPDSPRVPPQRAAGSEQAEGLGARGCHDGRPPK
jgi:hypothetical protein